MAQRAIFFDRDATLIEDKHYMHKVEDIHYFQDTFESLKALSELNYRFFIVTNQSGIGRGMFKETDMHKVHKRMLEDFEKKGIKFESIAFCPHAPKENCDCRKPSPKMINDLASEYDIDLKLSYMVGDKMSDVESGQNAGCTGILISENKKHDLVFKNLTEFTEYIKRVRKF